MILNIFKNEGYKNEMSNQVRHDKNVNYHSQTIRQKKFQFLEALKNVT